ncbi:Folate receptor-like [Dillenia turbinata]|uniref:Folate receptor-like n=1 Tax=Dillenia turbinata TaxID=194707 RepID=A0AAN8UA31_9MAGN
MMRPHCFLLLSLLFSIVNFSLSSSSGKPDGLCISQGGRFPPFTNEGKPPQRLKRGPKDLTLCRVFRRKTCCDVSQTHPALITIRKLAVTGEASQECLHLWEMLECSICDPRVGVRPGPPVVCASFCDKVFQACSDAYFSMDAKTQVLAPCGVNDFICGRASQWISNGTELCKAAGFAVKSVGIGIEETSCYGGKASLDSIADSWKASQSEVNQRFENPGWLEDLHLWVKEMSYSERVSWAIGGMVLTAGLIFLSKRKSYGQRQRLAAIQRTAKKLEGRMNQTSFVSTQGRRRSSAR